MHIAEKILMTFFLQVQSSMTFFLQVQSSITFFLQVRDDELEELDQLLDESCAIVIKQGAEDVEGKANILLQTFISSGEVRSFSLVSDLMYVAQVGASS